MKLKVRAFKIEAGKPIVFIHQDNARDLALHTGDRVRIRYGKKRAISIVDIVKSFIDKGEIVLSKEVLSRLKVKPGETVTLSLTPNPESSRILKRRIACEEYTKKDLKSIMQDIVNNALTDAEIAYFVSGVHHCGMSLKETIALTEAIFETGNSLYWNGRLIADKHSIGGVPGNRTTPIVVSICAAAGITMPKTSSRAITSAAGTADVIESIAKVNFSIDDLKKIVSKTGACLAWGGSLGLAPADDKLIQVEKILSLDPEPQLIASIMAKKLAVGSNHVLIDIPYGDGAKVSKEKALKLRTKFLKIGKHFKMKMKVVLTDGTQPIGNGIGPILEIRDVLAVLSQKNQPKDLEKKAKKLAGAILELTGKAKKNHGEKLASEILASGLAYKKFEEIIKAQKGSINHLPKAKFEHHVLSKYTGRVKQIDNKSINQLARVAGCPQDKPAGLYLHKHKGDPVKKGEKFLTIYTNSKEKLEKAIIFLEGSMPFLIK